MPKEAQQQIQFLCTGKTETLRDRISDETDTFVRL